MVWAGISSANRTDLVFLDGNLTGVRYRDEVVRPVILPFVRRHNLTLQQDNARPHTARVVTDFINQENIATLPWPAFSPDMSPIEHLWDILDRRVRARIPIPNTLRTLQNALREEWQAIPQQEIRMLVRSMRRRRQAMIASNGGHTRY